jgi:single-stranded-DNA-specific exonuclease
VAVINPKRRDCTYPDKHLAGVGVALKLVQALCGRTGREKWLPAFVKIAAIGTLADVVPLVGENRAIAKEGLALLSKGPHKVGLQALLDAAGLGGTRDRQLPRGLRPGAALNAAGRMARPTSPSNCCCWRPTRRARTKRGRWPNGSTRRTAAAGSRSRRSSRRRARPWKADPRSARATVLVVAGEGWHRGVIGIVASKLVDAYHRPVVVLSMEDGVAHGSCRSIPAFDMLAALEACAGHLARFGGHRQAAGLTLEADRLKAFRAALQDYGDARLQPDDLRPRLRLDGDLAASRHPRPPRRGGRAPGALRDGEPRPVFAAGPVEVVDGPRRLKERHLKMAVRQGGRIFRVMAWRGSSARRSCWRTGPRWTWRSRCRRIPSTARRTPS